jgi:hypothetical protein
MNTKTEPQTTRSHTLRAWLPLGIPLALMVAMPTDVRGQSSDDLDHWISIEVEPVAVLGVTGAAVPSFAIRTPSTPGAAPVIQITDPGHRFLQFTSIVGAPGATRRVTASHNGEVPDGFVLELRIWDEVDGEAARGTLGTTGSGYGWQTKKLSEVDHDVISGIGSGFTGTGMQDGWRFTYRLAVSNEADPNVLWSNLTAHTAAVQVFLTLTEEEGGDI